MVGLSNVDNTSDANKPVSTATKTALDSKASLNGYREGALLYAGSDGKLTSLNAGTAGQALVMNSSGKVPEWGSAAAAKGGYREGAFLYAGSDGNLTALNGGTAGQALVMNSNGKAPEWGTAGVAEGGYREGALLYAGSNGKLTALNGGTAGQALVMNSSGKAPEWKAAAGGVAKDGYTAGDFLYAADSRDNELIVLSAGRAGQVLTMKDAKTPEWKDAAGGVAKDGYAAGDFLYADSRGELTALKKGAAGQALVMDARGTAPEWGSAGVANGGYTAGDFLYASSRGELTTLSAGRAGQVLVMKDATTPEWGSANKPYSIGDFVHGGIVFWVDETGQHGLVCAKEDHSASVRWFGGTNGNTQAKGDGVYAGKANTTIIIAATVSIGDDNVTYAARVCNELQVTEGGKTYGDWYLPSNHELNLMYQNSRTINTTAGNNSGSNLASTYWSSKEIDNDSAWLINMSTGNGADTNKATNSKVRAVRAF